MLLLLQLLRMLQLVHLLLHMLIVLLHHLFVCEQLADLMLKTLISVGPLPGPAIAVFAVLLPRDIQVAF